MGAWRGAVLLCSLMMGCGGPGEDTSLPGGGDEPQATNPSEGSGDRMGTPSPGSPSTSPAFGTAHLVADLLPPSDDLPRLMSGPENLVGFQGRLYFTTDTTLWSSDGTQAGTAPVKQFSAVMGPTAVGNQLFFAAAEAGQSPGLWVTDGTSGGTRRVKDFGAGTEWDSAPYRLTELGGRLLFFRYLPDSSNGTNRTELWTSDGTEAGTQLVRELGADSSLSNMQTRVGNTLYFVFTDAAHGTELWRTDGTSAGTALVKDVQPGAASAYPSDLQVLGSSVFFLASTSAQGHELWRTDGSEAGTVRVRELSADYKGPMAYLMPGTGSQLFLGLSDPSDHLLRLSALTVDGSGAVQEQPVATLPNAYADKEDSDPMVGEAKVAGGKVFFSLYISSPGPAPRDAQLWVTDGTPGGTAQVSRPLSLSDEFRSELFALDERLLYSNISEGYGLEPWVSDGTAAGTRMVQDIAPGAEYSFPRYYTPVGNAVFFTAYTPANGNELWVLPLGQ